jgi:GT2 family glycosyltransferase
MQVLVSIVLGSYNRKPFLKSAIQSIRQNHIEVPYEIIVVDGGSTDGSMDWLAKQKDIITIIQHNHGEFRGKPVVRKSWGYFMNLAFKAAQGEYICMISDDTLLLPHAVMNGINHIIQAREAGKKIGAAAFYWRNNWPVDNRYMVSRTLGDVVFINHGLYVREALEEIGWIEEERYQFYCADIDVCLRLNKAGYEILDVPTAFVEHYFHATLTGRERISATKLADEAAFRQYWFAEYPDSDQAIVKTPLELRYQDPQRTGYRLYPRVAIFKIRLRMFFQKGFRRLRRLFSPAEGL